MTVPSKLILDWLVLAERGAPERTWLYWEPSTSTWNVGYGGLLGKDFGKISKTWGLGVSESWLKRNVGKCPPPPYKAPTQTASLLAMEAKLGQMTKDLAVDLTPVPPRWQDLTLDLLYQFGPTTLRSSDYLKDLLKGDLNGALLNALGFRKVGGLVSKGLELRRAGLCRWAVLGLPAKAPWSPEAYNNGWNVETVKTSGVPKK